MTNTFIVDSVGGISGSLTQLVDGSSYLVAGNNVTITSQSNGSVLIEASSTVPQTYGNGADGDVIISGSTTLSRDMYYASLIVNSGVTLSSHGYRIFVQGSCVVSGTIDNSGGDGSNGPGGSIGPGGVGGQSGCFLGGRKGEGNDGAAGNTSFGVLGINAFGGRSAVHTGGDYRSIWGIIPMGTQIPDAIEGIVYSPAGTSCQIGGGAGGAAGAQGSGGGGAGVVAVIAKTLTVATGGSITAIGGHNDPNGWGGGGGGGLILIVTSGSYVNNGSISAAGGVGYQNGGDGLVAAFSIAQ